MYTGSSNYHRSLSGMHKKTGGSKQRQRISKNKKKLSLCYRTPFGSNRYGRIFLEDLILLNQDRIVKAPPVSQYTVQSTSADEEKSESEKSWVEESGFCFPGSDADSSDITVCFLDVLFYGADFYHGKPDLPGGK